MAGRVLSKTAQITGITNTMKLSELFVRLMSANAGPTNVGFIGCGNMGAHMVRNLAKKGHKLHVYDVSPQACNAVQSSTVSVCKNQREVAENSEFVITMLPNNDIVSQTYEQMVGDGLKGKTFIDSSTIDPNVAKTVQKLVKSKGSRFVDAPVSGGVIGAENATLTFMVGGTAEDYDTVKALLECMGQQITHCGSYGMGQAAKLCNNMMLGISMIGVCETMNLAVRLGLDAKVFSDIINSSTGRCWSSEIYNPVPGICSNAPCNRDYAGGFSTALITKDLGLAAGIATASNTPIPLGAAAHQIYRTLQCKGLGNKDFSYVYEYLKEQTQQQ